MSELHDTSWIPGFIDGEHFAHALAVARKLRWIGSEPCESAGALDQLLQAKFPSP